VRERRGAKIFDCRVYDVLEYVIYLLST